MRQAAENAKKEISQIAAAQRKKKMRLTVIACALAATDFFLFVRLIQCGGSFFCKSNSNSGYYGY